jgi:hypothetical protein
MWIEKNVRGVCRLKQRDGNEGRDVFVFVQTKIGQPLARLFQTATRSEGQTQAPQLVVISPSVAGSEAPTCTLETQVKCTRPPS